MVKPFLLGYYKQGKYKLAAEILDEAGKRTAIYDRFVLEHLAKAGSAVQNAN